MSQFPLDEPVELSEKPGVSVIVSTFRALEALNKTGQPWTPRRLGMRMAMGGLHPCPVGSAEEVADVFEEWIDVADVDGFNIGLVTNPQSSHDILELLIPELQKRSLFWKGYDVPGGTFRENLFGSGQNKLRDDYYGHSYHYGNGKEVMPKKAERTNSQ